MPAQEVLSLALVASGEFAVITAIFLGGTDPMSGEGRAISTFIDVVIIDVINSGMTLSPSR